MPCLLMHRRRSMAFCVLCLSREAPKLVVGREKPLPMRPPPLPSWDSVFAWSWLGRMAPDNPCELWDENGNERDCVYWLSVADSRYNSMGCDDATCDGSDDGDSFYFTPLEVEDPNEVRFFPLIFP